MTVSMRAGWWLVVLLVLCLVAAACTPAADPEEQEAAEDGSFQPGDIRPAPGRSVDVPGDVLQAAESWLIDSSGLSDLLLEEIFLSEVRQTRDVLHLRFVQQHGGVSVRGAEFILHVRESGDVLGASQSLSEILPAPDATEELTAEQAAEIAEKAVSGTVTNTQTQPTWLEVGTDLRLGWEVFVTTDEPAAYSVVIDATTGDVLTVDLLSNDRGQLVAQAGCQAPAAPSACVFTVDPYYASGDPRLDPNRANEFLVGVALANVTDPATLQGRYVQIVQARDDDGRWGTGGRGGSDGSFEAGMAYYWIDYTQSAMQAQGYRYHADDPVEVVPVDPQVVDNAFYIPTEDRIHLGVGSEGVMEGEDAQTIIHEYGHGVLESQVPNITSSEGGAFHESFGDLLAVLVTLEFRRGDVGCLFAWPELGECIRRIDDGGVYPTDLAFEPHLDGVIFSSAVWDTFRAMLQRETGLAPEDCQDRSTLPCNAVRDEVLAILLGSLQFLTPRMTLDDAASAFAAADATFFDGRNAAEIASGFGAHGLAPGGTPAVQVEGLEGLSGGARAASTVGIKILHAYRGDLAVDLDVVDSSGAALCSATIRTPDENDDADNVTGLFRIDGTECESHLPPGPDRIWRLTVADTLAEDVGEILQFVVTHGAMQYPAPGLPLGIPDADPGGITITIGGPDPGVPEAMTDTGGGSTPEGPPPAGDVVVGVEISHSYVGDLSVRLAVLDVSAETILCDLELLAPDANDASSDLTGTADASDCAEFYPPTSAQPWLLFVEDTAAVDTGTIDRFTISGPDGRSFAAVGPISIPDDDRDGAALEITG